MKSARKQIKRTKMTILVISLGNADEVTVIWRSFGIRLDYLRMHVHALTFGKI